MKKTILCLFIVFSTFGGMAQSFQSEFVFYNENQQLVHQADGQGNTIPDFSKVGYASGEREIPDVSVVETVEPVSGDNRKNIQDAVDRLSARPLGPDGFRGTVLLKKGTYNVNGSIFIKSSGIVIRGEGASGSGTTIRETATTQIDLFCFEGSGGMNRMESTKVAINEDFVPVGRKYVTLADASSFQVGDSVLLCRPGTDNWIHDLKMDQIVEREGTRQWKASDYNLYFERIITKIDGNTVHLDNSVVMQMEKKYGGGFLMKYTFTGRIKNCGIENLLMESTYQNDTDEEHGWNAINFSKVDQGWASNVISKYFAYSCVTIDPNSRNISVLNSQCLDAKSIITGGRRYSFNCNGQLNLFKNCYTTEGRHDYVTGSKVLGPNVFTQCKSRKTHADIGPHHRWACGTLYDMVDTDGEINVQDRGNWGSGHGWAGVTQIVWNCRVSRAAVQSPWVSGKNYCIGLTGGKYDGRLSGRPDGVWEGQNIDGIVPESLYEAQRNNNLTTGAALQTPSEKINVYPNPSQGKVKIVHPEKSMNYNFYSMNGTKLKSGKITGSMSSLDLHHFENGVYLLECFSENKTYIEKIFINKHL